MAAYGVLVAAPLLFLFGRAALERQDGPPRSAGLRATAEPSREDDEPPIRMFPTDLAPPFPDLEVVSLYDGTRVALIETA